MGHVLLYGFTRENVALYGALQAYTGLFGSYRGIWGYIVPCRVCEDDESNGKEWTTKRKLRFFYRDNDRRFSVGPPPTR